MKQFIDLNAWNRKEHFNFFSQYDDPYFGITTLVDFTHVYKRSKAQGRSFFLCSVHHLLTCVNEVEAFKLRIEEGQVALYDTIGFGFFEYNTHLDSFIRNAEKEINRVRSSSGLSFPDRKPDPNVIYYSAVPWFAFSEMKHAVSSGKGDSVPRISTGKLVQENEKFLLPLSVYVHHGLADGSHVAELIRKLHL